MPHNDEFLAANEPEFLDAALLAAEFGQRTLSAIRDTIDSYWDALLQALGFAQDELEFSDYWLPERLWDANPEEPELNIGAKISLPDICEFALYRYWAAEGTGIQACIWMKDRASLDRLSQAIAVLPGEPPPPADAWEFYLHTDGIYYITRVLGEENADIEDLLIEFAGYVIQLVAAIGGVRKYLP